MTLTHDRCALNLYSREPGAFDIDVVAVGEQALESRAVIEQAKGVLIGQLGGSADEAFDRLVELSQRSNRKVREVALSVVEAAAKGPQGA